MEDMVGTGYMKAGVQELHKLLKDDDMWIKSSEEEGGRDVLDEDKYQKAFPRSSKRNHIMRSWTTESSRAVTFIPINHLDLAYMITAYAWSFLFPNMVATDKTVKVFSSDESPHMSSQVVVKQLHAASPMIATRKFLVHRKCLQIDQGTWIVAEISLVDAANPKYFHRLPSGCLIQRITDHQSKVTWVEHTEVDSALPNQTSAFAFGAQRMAAWLERFCEKSSVTNATCTLKTKRIVKNKVMKLEEEIYTEIDNLRLEIKEKVGEIENKILNLELENKENSIQSNDKRQEDDSELESIESNLKELEVLNIDNSTKDNSENEYRFTNHSENELISNTNNLTNDKEEVNMNTEGETSGTKPEHRYYKERPIAGDYNLIRKTYGKNKRDYTIWSKRLQEK
ncbi:homeobox-leucine zipper protein HDG11 [Tanacetum coccineum]